MLYLLSYDIENNRIRQKAAKKILAAGLERIQFSVYIGTLGEVQKETLMSWIEKELKKDKDYSVILVPLHQDMQHGIACLSKTDWDWEYLKGEKLTLFF